MLAVPSGWGQAPPKNDADYFERLSRAIFAAGLNWRVVDSKWPAFRKAFDGFSPARVAAFNEREVARLMADKEIVRNERKIRATIENAKTVLSLKSEHGSFNGYLDSFGKKEEALLEDLHGKFSHVGPSSARMFLWMADYPLTPTKEEKLWMKSHSHSS